VKQRPESRIMHLPTDGQILGRGMTALAWAIAPVTMI
jgi:hypothetical protein